MGGDWRKMGFTLITLTLVTLMPSASASCSAKTCTTGCEALTPPPLPKRGSPKKVGRMGMRPMLPVTFS